MMDELDLVAIAAASRAMDDYKRKDQLIRELWEDYHRFTVSPCGSPASYNYHTLHKRVLDELRGKG